MLQQQQHTTRDLATTTTTYRQQKQHEQKSSFFMKLHISDLYNEDIEAEAKKAASKSSMKISPKAGFTQFPHYHIKTTTLHTMC